MEKEIIILGAGPAGMTAALFAAQAGARVTLVERNAQVGRKLLVTGSGRANLSNHGVAPERYFSSSQAEPWLAAVFAQFGPADLVQWLRTLGLLTYSTADGWVYPLSNSAQSVVQAFASALERAGVEVLLEHRLLSMRNIKDGFELGFEGQPSLRCRKLLIAAGGKAYPTLGSQGDVFPLLQKLGHALVPLVPALGPVTCDMRAYPKLQGVRLDAQATLLEHKQVLAETRGNLIFTQWGLNGPAVMDLSHQVARHAGSGLELHLNFLLDHEAELRALLEAQRHSDLPVGVLPGSSLPPKLSAFLLERCRLPASLPLRECSDAQLAELWRWCTAFPLSVTGVRDFDTCQVSAGGIPLDEVDPQTLQSRLVPGLYFAGEALDVTGPCGGYNLQFAFSTGAVAGKGISQ